MATILVVDDHPITREPLARLLRYEGFQTASAGNGAEALAALESADPDLVVLDVMMPKVNGPAFLEALRGEPRWARWKDVPVIVLTGAMDQTQVRRAAELGASDVILKAKFTFDQLLSRIRACLSAPAPAAGGA